MAIPKVKSTYSLDLDTVEALDRVARHWQVSKSEALRRAIHAVAAKEAATEHPALDALDALQRSLGLTPQGARAWGRRAEAERRASSGRAETRRA